MDIFGLLGAGDKKSAVKVQAMKRPPGSKAGRS